VVVAAGGVGLPVERGAVVLTTGARVVAVVPAGSVPDAGSVAGGASTLLDVELDDDGGRVGGMMTRAVVDGAMVLVADWVATCCLGELSLPVATSNSRATSASEARAYSATLIR
jgi:hypothetical protein